jgi:hypothetical protein
MSARILNVTEEEYHADPCADPSLSHSIAHILVSESPRHAWLAHPRLGGQGKQRAATKAMDEGAILHALLLGKGAQFEMAMHDSWRTKQSQADKAAILEAGKIPILSQHFESLLKAATRVAENAAAQGFPLGVADSESEVSIEFTERVGDHDVLCRCRMDQIRADHVIYDVKSCRSANPRDIQRTIVQYGMDIQHVAYTRAYEQLVPDALGRADFVFLFCETEPPYEVVPARLDGIFKEIGTRRWDRALRQWRQLLLDGSWPWPGYSDGAVTLIPPSFVISQELPDEEYA